MTGFGQYEPGEYPYEAPMPGAIADPTVTTPEGLTFWPWSDGYAVGFAVTRTQDDRIDYVVLNPSSEHHRTDFDGRGDVFVYAATNTTDPVNEGGPVCFIDLFAPEEEN